jgi:hypothetical protein
MTVIPALRRAGVERTGASIIVTAPPNGHHHGASASFAHAVKLPWTVNAEPHGTAPPSYRRPRSDKSP